MSRLFDIAQETRASQDHFELWQLLETIAQLNPKKILEVGVHRGGMLETLSQAFPDAKLTGIDIDYSELEFNKFTAIAGHSQDPEIRDRVLDEYDFIFIDGDHTYEAVKADYEMYAPLVRPGGIIGFHDIMRAPDRVPHHIGVDCRKVFNELKRRHASTEIWNGTAGDDAPGIGLLFL